ncbi:aminotransferase class IV [Herbiconiux sp. L3-i23]|uniref:aminotransferase class IV n=1 Tax=Herbiconiux sp. L3-i23 TaxID=2905871 RepID=UPI002058ED19|nr:aminotransferase class IV [Herbiconiux sp. L3-i23]BDI23097.1 hypothetical protein L3i23_18730 [Herbiconiux sp. L3-i23]
MSEQDAGAPALSRFRNGALEAIDTCEVAPTAVVAADSWFVDDGRVLAIDLHRQRFLRSIPAELRPEGEAFFDAVLAALPRQGEWFPRVDLRRSGERYEFQFRSRPAPRRERSVVLATHRGRDPRREPTVKGPDLEAMLRIRTEAQSRGAGEAVITSPEGYLVEGAYSALVWWRGDILALPSDDLERVDSVTARSLETLATALGTEVVREHTTANELDGHEVWALSALHGIRIATAWIDGPSLAERPGRLDLWRRRLDALRRPLP